MDKLHLAEKPTILLVDDTPDNLTLMSNVLRSAYRVKIANCGEKALKIASSDQPPDLILLDIMMPGMDGYEVCRQLKRNPNTMNIPVIFLTAMTETEDEQKGLELGAVDYITKPISPAIVMARVRNHLALQKINRELESAKLVAEKANLAKSSFLSSMSHELRSPLNAILGFAQLMESESPPPTSSQVQSITQIIKAGWHLLELINEILDLAKVESGQVPMLKEPVSLDAVMLECQGMTAPLAKQRGITMSFPPPDETWFVSADRTRVKQVLINLLSNAVKYNREHGSIEITCTATTPGRIRVNIKDTGAGLTPEQLTQLFQAFNRLGQETGIEEGTGIGLVVSKRLIELMGGTIGADSTPEVGSVFWFELASAAQPHLPVEMNVATQPDIRRQARIHTLLYVEDNPANLQLVERIIAHHPDLALLTATNATLGIELARTHLPDLILMDINLPGISGTEAMKILREDQLTKHIPVLAVSANAIPLDIETGIRAGFFRYITKPIKIGEFMETLDSALEFADKTDLLKKREK
ncbi:MAG: response regulator [Gallionella sp.]|nr:response regulator [Gallionella sp.]